MSTARPTLAASPREILGKKVAGLRQAGRLPAVVYGHGVDSRSLSLDTHEFELLTRHVGPNTLVDLTVEGTKAMPVLVHGVQRDPIHRRMLHVDLFAVRMTEELTVEVPIVTTGSSLAIEQHGGTLLHLLESVKVRALPDHLPHSIELPIDSLVDFETTLHVRDLPIPGDVTLLTDADEAVARVQAPRIEEPEPVAPTVGEGAPEEGEPAEAADATEAPTEG
jgi:large subunit ribosomal protein L25